jgi:hypothetical protein
MIAIKATEKEKTILPSLKVVSDISIYSNPPEKLQPLQPAEGGIF